MNDELSRDNLPHGWSLARWNAAKGEVRSVVWRTGKLRQLISYKGLTEQLESEPLFWRSAILRGLLNEIATDEVALGGPWVTALVVRSRSKYPGGGFFKVVPEREWQALGKTRFCQQQQDLAVSWVLKHPDGE